MVPAEVYDDDYYRSGCAGSEEWSRSGGACPAAIYEGCLERARLAPGEVVVDIGTGRGELLAVGIARGASLVVGVEYSRAGVALSRQTIAAHRAEGRAEVVLADARALPLDDGRADLVTLLDVVEHLSPEELDATLGEIRRVLRPGGRLFIHTMPNRSIYAITYRAQRAVRPSRRRRWPRDPRNEYEHRMHVNEQTVTGLRRTLRAAGFRRPAVETGQWVYADFVPDESARRLYGRLARHRLTARLGVANIFAEATR